jgi:hypothetical protein
VLLVGHLLEYRPGAIELNQLIEDGELGRVLYIHGNRLRLGKLRANDNALRSLGAHDVSVLLRQEPYAVDARGESSMREGIANVVFCLLRFPDGVSAHLHLSWLDPHEERCFAVVGDARMATFDDMALESKITVYHKGFDEQANSYSEYITRSGEICRPRLPNVEPLRTEVEHFVSCVRDGTTTRSDGESGLRVVRVLEQRRALMPQLSVVVVTHNDRAEVAASLPELRLDGRDELVVVDNASGDGTVGLVREVAPHARIVKTGHNAGFAAAANAGGDRRPARVLRRVLPLPRGRRRLAARCAWLADGSASSLAAVVDDAYELAKGAARWRHLERNRWATILRWYETRLLVLPAPDLLATELALLDGARAPRTAAGAERRAGDADDLGA